MPSNSLTAILKNIPSFYNKTLGTPSVTPTIITMPWNTTAFTSNLLGGTPGPSNITQLMDSVGFSLDHLLENVKTVKDISYVGIVPVEISDTSNIKLIFGQSGVSFGQFGYPQGIVVDSSGNILVCASTNNCIQKYNSLGQYQSQFGVIGSGNGQLNTPLYLALDSSGNIYVTDSGNHRIQKFDQYGNYLLQWGNVGTVGEPCGIAVSPFNGNVYVTDTINNVVREFTPTGSLLNTLGGPGFNSPLDIAIDSLGNIYVTDSGNYRIQQFTNINAYVTSYGSFGTGPLLFQRPVGIATDSSGLVYVTDSYSNNVQVFSPTGSGVWKATFGGPGNGPGQFNGCVGIAVDSLGYIYTSDLINNRIEVFASEIVTGSNSFPLFQGTFEDNALPGYVFNVNQITSGINFTIPFPISFTKEAYVTINNTGSTPFTCYSIPQAGTPGDLSTYISIPITIAPGQSEIYTFSPNAVDQMWIPVNTQSQVIYGTTTALNAVSVPGPINPNPSLTTQDLDPLGFNYGSTRIYGEDDKTYKKRIRNKVVGTKLTPGSIINQFRTIYGINVSVYQWFSSSYSQLVSLLTPLPEYSAFYLNGAPVTLGQIPLNLSNPTGPYNFFYVVIPSGIVPNFQMGVYPNNLVWTDNVPSGDRTYPDWSFANFKDTTVGIPNGGTFPGNYTHGGFFKANLGENEYTISDFVMKYLFLISAIKAAGTDAILIVLP
jgi:DNA-binding beta-propeller fold protein YncE